MIKAAQVEVRKVLAEVVTDGKTISTVDDLIQQIQKLNFLKLPAKHCLQHIMVNGWIKLFNIKLQAILGVILVTKSSDNFSGCGVDPAILYAAVSICCKIGHEYRLQYIHDGMMHDPVWVVWKTVNLSFLWLIHLESHVLGSPERSRQNILVKLLNIGLPVTVMHFNSVLTGFTFSGYDISQFKVLDAYNFLKYVAYTFHAFAY